VLSKSLNIQAISGPVIIGDGLGGQDADVLRLINNNQIADTANVTVNKTGLFDLNNKNETIRAWS